MKRRQGFEWEDQPWFPSFLRQYMMDFLRFVLNTGNLYQPVTPILLYALQQSGSTCIIDLCSGGGGAVQSIQKNMEQATGKTVPFVLTDLYPTLSYSIYSEKNKNAISYYKDPVDATLVPSRLRGFRTIFSGFHHFDEPTAKKVLQNAVDNRQGIAIFDGGNRGIGFILLILFFHPIAFLLFTPFIKPFSLRRCLFTYLIPVVPLCTIWDGIASALRLYMPDELMALAKNTESSNYLWQSGFITNQLGLRIAYLTGYPSDNADQPAKP